MNLKDVKGLDPQFRHDVCGAGNKDQPRCMYLQYARTGYGLMLICIKGTPLGDRHRERIEKLVEKNPDGSLQPEIAGEKLNLQIISADNCPDGPGRGEEFAFLLEQLAPKKE